MKLQNKRDITRNCIFVLFRDQISSSLARHTEAVISSSGFSHDRASHWGLYKNLRPKRSVCNWLVRGQRLAAICSGNGKEIYNNDKISPGIYAVGYRRWFVPLQRSDQSRIAGPFFCYERRRLRGFSSERDTRLARRIQSSDHDNEHRSDEATISKLWLFGNGQGRQSFSLRRKALDFCLNSYKLRSLCHFSWNFFHYGWSFLRSASTGQAFVSFPRDMKKIITRGEPLCLQLGKIVPIVFFFFFSSIFQSHQRQWKRSRAYSPGTRRSN